MTDGGFQRTHLIREGDRCDVQPTGDRCLDKHVHLPGVQSMTFRDAMAWGYLTWQHPVPLHSDRSYALWTAKAVEQQAYMQNRPT